ncbi:hypothetical protein VB712_18945 [Spirulina sp. CCNP1310]|uniref:hypothetical protein n=1 Tax=Spirulina sp. CCNP1310 TaxID=3110249 RepID=UPI002B20D086|nr:hypothetical protein [Spirulina sp. CCNP1310]MEA5421307.1 hypothetical protein [Spirulina sp. CCNP1310]
MGLEQFRRQHPDGGILSELVLYEQGQYVVRCCLTVGGEAIATALSAAPTVEAAEEQARDRALALFTQLAAIAPDQGQSIPPAVAPVVPQTVVKEAIAPQPAPPQDMIPPAKPAPPPAATVPSFTDVSNPLPPAEPAAMQDTVAIHDGQSPVGNQRTPIASDPSPEPPIFDDPLPPDEEPEPLPPEAFTPAPPPAAPGEPIDFSDIIAKTNLELKRLGWTSDQGRTYIMETYGKRSRQFLTDSELVEFLHHLESQP